MQTIAAFIGRAARAGTGGWQRLARAAVLGCLVIAAPAPAADDLQTQFDAAVTAMEADRLGTARELLETVLGSNPAMHRARLELARVYYLDRDYSAARAQAQQVLDDPNIPFDVRVTVLAFLAQVDADEQQQSARHVWTPSIYLGVMYDSNVNVGPQQDVIQIGGSQFAVSGEREDGAFIINPAISHTFNPGRRFSAGEHSGYLLWQSSASAYLRRYFDETDFNLGVLTLRTGPAWVVPRHWRASLGLQADQIWLGDGRLALFTSLNPSVHWQLGETTELGVEGVVTRRDYNDASDSDREGWYKWAGVTLGQSYRERTIALKAGAGYMWFDTDDNAQRFAYDGPDLFVGAAAESWENGLVFAKVGYRSYDYQGLEPGFPNPRDEDEWRYTLGFQHSITSGLLDEWLLIGKWEHTDNDSNVPIYGYQRDQVSLGLSRSF